MDKLSELRANYPTIQILKLIIHIKFNNKKMFECDIVIDIRKLGFKNFVFRYI